jgi:2-alkenal reductase
MERRLFHLPLLGPLVALVALAALLSVDGRLFPNATARPVTPRGGLADFERLTIDIFERVSPSVVQIVAHRRGGGVAPLADEDSIQSETGFV